MDPLSLATASFGLAGSITTLIFQISQFVAKVKDAQKDLDAVTKELESLKFALEFLEEDTATPDGGGEAIPVASIIGNLEDVVKQISVCLSREGEMRLTRKIRWAFSGRDEMDKLRRNLENYKSTLDIALDILAL
jgi:hypothetical protein